MHVIHCSVQAYPWLPVWILQSMPPTSHIRWNKGLASYLLQKWSAFNRSCSTSWSLRINSSKSEKTYQFNHPLGHCRLCLRAASVILHIIAVSISYKFTIQIQIDYLLGCIGVKETYKWNSIILPQDLLPARFREVVVALSDFHLITMVPACLSGTCFCENNLMFHCQLFI